MQTRDINLQLFRKQMAVLRRFIWGAGQVTKSGWPIQKEGSKNCFIIVIDINIKTAVHLYFKYLVLIILILSQKWGGGVVGAMLVPRGADAPPCLLQL